MKQEIKDLLISYELGECTAEQEQQIEAYLESGEIQLSDLENLHLLKSKYDTIETPEPSGEMTANFYAQLHEQERKSSAKVNIKEWWASLWSHQPVVRWAYSVVLVAIGVVGSLLFNNQGGGQDANTIETLAEEVTQMKEMMMLTLLEKESTSDRLKAVSLTSEIDEASSTIIDALVKTLNNDENVNVRLSALEALYPYSDKSEVRTALIQSISQQESPIVQVTLAEMMVNLQEKKSVKELKKILDNEDTPPEIKERVKESIDVLI